MIAKKISVKCIRGIAVILIMTACMPYDQDLADELHLTRDIGNPSVMCRDENHVWIKFPVSEQVHRQEGVKLNYRGTDYFPEWSPSYSADFLIPAPIGGGSQVYLKFHSVKKTRYVIWENGEPQFMVGDIDYFVDIPDCTLFESGTKEPSDVPPVVELPTNRDGIPTIWSTTCLQDGQLMIVFNFPAPIIGVYAAQVNETEYQYTPVPDYPDRAYFFGPPPENQGLASISLSTVPDGVVVFEQQEHPFPACGVQTATDGEPVIYNATCLQGNNLMVAFEFPEPVTGQYEAVIDGQVYQYTPVPNYPNRAYYFGPPPEYQGPVSVSLSTIPDGGIVFEQQDYEFPACGVQRPKKDGGGGGSDHYVPPSY